MTLRFGLKVEQKKNEICFHQKNHQVYNLIESAVGSSPDSRCQALRKDYSVEVEEKLTIVFLHLEKPSRNYDHADRRMRYSVILVPPILYRFSTSTSLTIGSFHITRCTDISGLVIKLFIQMPSDNQYFVKQTTSPQMLRVKLTSLLNSHSLRGTLLYFKVQVLLSLCISKSAPKYRENGPLF